MNPRILVLILAFCSHFTDFFAQRIQIVESSNLESVPFVKVYPDNGNPFLADIDGYFTPPQGCSSVSLKMNAFADTTFTLSGQTQLIIRAIGNELDEIVILPGVNPAERIMELAIQNRKKNHPMGDQTFRYTSYSKFIFTMNPDAIAAIPEETTDTTLVDLKALFGKQHLFLMESTTEKSYEPPFRQKELITAYQVSGFSDPAFSTFANELQTFNFYENSFDLLGNSYINPLAFGGIRRYLFILEDKTVNAGGDTTFTIRFQPRKDKNFDGMKGTLYINSQGYALEKVIAEPAQRSESIEPKIIQEYTFVDGKKWFPYKLSTEAIFPALRLNAKLKDGYLIGKGSTYIEHIELGADLSKERFNGVEVQTTEDANLKDSTHWENQRKYQLTDKEKTTYAVVDSISKKENLDQKLNLLKTLAEGKIPLGYVQLDIKRLLDYNDYEGYRIGLGLETSNKLSKRAMVGTYAAYGTIDKKWKYGVYGRLILFPKQFVTLDVRYQDDVYERGGTRYLAVENSFSLDSYSQHLYVREMERQRLAEVSLSGYIMPRLKWLVAANHQQILITDGYTFSGQGAQLDKNTRYKLSEASTELVWTIRERLMYFGTKRVSLGSKWPKLSARFATGVTGIYGSQLNYNRFNVSVQQIVPIRAVGKLSYMITAGMTDGDVPAFLLQGIAGSGGRMWNISVPNTFETMRPNAYYSSQNVAVFARFTFKALKTNKKFTTPQLALHHAAGVGELSSGNTTGLLQSFPKGYYEGGLLINHLINIGSAGFGIGAFYHYGPYATPYFEKNLTLKIGLSIGLN